MTRSTNLLIIIVIIISYVVQVNKPASLCVAMETAGALSAYVVSPSQQQSDAIVQPLDQGRHIVVNY